MFDIFKSVLQVLNSGILGTFVRAPWLIATGGIFTDILNSGTFGDNAQTWLGVGAAVIGIGSSVLDKKLSAKKLKTVQEILADLKEAQDREGQ